MAKSDPTVFGFLNINKPLGITAHDVVARIRRVIRVRQVGHGGTLDPMAEGVLPVAVGKATRLLRFMDGKKIYLGEIRLGVSTDTEDLQGKILQQVADDFAFPPPEQVSTALRSFVGEISQVPPMYSAVHVGGQRLYALARAGATADDVEVPVRNVLVESIEELGYEPPVVRVRIACAAGTYIRSIARDVGAQLGCGGALQSLVREAAGPFSLQSAVALDELDGANWQSHLVAPQSCLPLACLTVSDDQARKLSLGQSVEVSVTAWVQAAQEYVVAMYDNSIVAVCRLDALEAQAPSVRIHPEVVLFDGQQSK